MLNMKLQTLIKAWFDTLSIQVKNCAFPPLCSCVVTFFGGHVPFDFKSVNMEINGQSHTCQYIYTSSENTSNYTKIVIDLKLRKQTLLL